jgi:hypothetical protein
MTEAVVRSTGSPSAAPRPVEHSVKHLNQYQLACRWNISQRTLERWRWTRTGPPYLKVGGRVLYRLADIEAWEAAHVRNGTK